MAVSNGPHLYHYTDYRGFAGIVESGILWATNLFFLNDSEELRHGITRLKERLKSRQDWPDESKPSILADCLDIFEMMTGESAGASPLEDSIEVHGASFSEDEDVLSQWRAYCPNGGLAIGFDQRKLHALAEKQGVKLEKSIYDENEQVRKLDALLDELQHKAQMSDEVARHQPYDKSRYWRIADEHLWQQVLPVLPLLKHRGFSEEKEWRLVSSCFQAGDSLREAEFRLAGGALVPYKEIPLDDELWSDARIIISPGPHERRTKHAIRQLVTRKRCPISVSQIDSSQTPYRS